MADSALVVHFGEAGRFRALFQPQTSKHAPNQSRMSRFRFSGPLYAYRLDKPSDFWSAKDRCICNDKLKQVLKINKLKKYIMSFSIIHFWLFSMEIFLPQRLESILLKDYKKYEVLAL